MPIQFLKRAGVAAAVAHIAGTAIAAQDHPDSGNGWPWVHKAGDSSVSLLMMGDTNISYREDPREAFRRLRGTLREADFVFVNLEGPLAGGDGKTFGDSDIEHKNWRHSNPDQVNSLLDAGIDGVGVANNVTWPREALVRSLNVLEDAGVAWTGGGTSEADARAPLVFERKGVTVGIIQRAATVAPLGHKAYGTVGGIAPVSVHTAYQLPTQIDKPGQPPVVRTWLDEGSAKDLRDDVSALANETDLVVTSFHWGVSGTTNAIEYQREIAELVIDAGADVVFGHGPHKFQAIETYKGKPIFFSVGQGVFDDRRDVQNGMGRGKRNPDGLTVRLVAGRSGLEHVSFVPNRRDVEGDDYVRLHSPDTRDGQAILRELDDVIGTQNPPYEREGHELVITGINR